MNYVDIMDIRENIQAGRFVAKINSFNTLMLEDTQTCESIKLMQLPDGYAFHEKGTWEPCFIYTSHSIGRPLDGEEGWSCSVCGVSVNERTDWCTCGADMRASKINNKELEDLLAKL